MPVLSRPVSELTTHIFLPVIHQLAHRILATLGYEDAIGDRIFINTDWTAVGTTHDINHNPILGVTLFNVTPNIQLNPTSQKWDCYTFFHTAAYGIDQNTLRESYPVYFDPTNGVRIVEMRSPVTIALNCELILQSPELAWQTPQMLFNGHDNGAVFHFNDLAYDYPVPAPIVSVLYQIWKMDRLRGKENGVPFLQYLLNNSDRTWKVHRNRNIPKETELVIPVFDLKTLATLEYSDDKPEAIQKDKVAIGFKIPFNYTVQFALPTLNLMSYPISINNRLLPEQFIPIDTTMRFNNMEESHKRIPNEEYEKRYIWNREKQSGYMKFPFYDDWEIPIESGPVKAGYAPVAMFNILVNEEDPDLVTREDLGQELPGEYQLPTVLKNVLKDQDSASMGYNVLYSVQMYRENKLLIPGADWTFGNMHIEFKAMNTFAHYRCVIFMLMNLNYLHQTYYPILQKYFKDLPLHMKYWVKHMVESGPWKDPKWPPKVFMSKDGGVYDARHNLITRFQEMRRLHYAPSFTARVTNYSVFAGKSPKFEVRGTR